MSNLTQITVQAAYGDYLNGSNNGQGLTNALQNITDGLGNASAIQLSRTTLNVVGTLQIGGITLWQPNAAIVVPGYGADPAPTPGGIYYDTANNRFRACTDAGWHTITLV